MKAIALVVVRGGVAEVYEPLHVDVQVIDLDDLSFGANPVALPGGIGFEELAKQAGLKKGRQYTIEGVK